MKEKIISIVKIIIPILLIIFFILWDCGVFFSNKEENNEPKENNINENKISEIERISEETGIEIFDDEKYNYTIDYQRNDLKKTMLNEFYYFDIIQINNKIYLYDINYLDCFLIEITEEQLSEIKKVSDIESIIISFTLSKISPLNNYFPEIESEHDINISDYEETDTIDPTEYVNSYIDIDLNRIILGKCENIHSIIVDKDI